MTNFPYFEYLLSLFPCVYPLEPQSNTKPSKPPFVIFLDIDGVLYGNGDHSGIEKKFQELFQKDIYQATYLESCIAQAHFFDKEALKNLDHLIETIKKTKQVWIVISSDWRRLGTVPALKKTIFGMHNFSKYIVDKTRGFDQLTNEYCKIKYCDCQCRAAQIHDWLQRHPEVKENFIVIDDQYSDSEDYDPDGLHLYKNFTDKYFRTHMSTLLTEEICQKIINSLVIDPN